METGLMKFEFNGSPITFNADGDVMVNATEMIKAFPKKRMSDFTKNSQTIDFTELLESKTANPVLVVNHGGATPGTWMHQKLALKFAAWLSPEFELFVFDCIETILTTGKFEVKPISKSETILQAMMYLQADVESLKEQNQLQEKEIKTLAPKAKYCDNVLDTKCSHTSTSIGGDFGLTAIAFNKKLKEAGIIRKVGGDWVLTAKYLDKGYIDTKTILYNTSSGEQGASIQLRWTQKGRAFLHSIADKISLKKSSQLSML